MCGRFSQQRPASELAEIFAAEPLVDDLGPRYNVAPTDEALVVVQREERAGLTAYRWGLIPHWADGGKSGSKMFNARAETLTTSPVFREAFRRKRCLVPVDGFYEWKREGTVRQPYRDHAGAMGGRWRSPGSGRAGAIRRPRRSGGRSRSSRPRRTSRWPTLHDRMPVIVPEDAWSRWLDPDLADRGELLGLLAPTDDTELDIRAVSAPRERRPQRRSGAVRADLTVRALVSGRRRGSRPGPRPGPRTRPRPLRCRGA